MASVKRRMIALATSSASKYFPRSFGCFVKLTFVLRLCRTVVVSNEVLVIDGTNRVEIFRRKGQNQFLSEKHKVHVLESYP